MVFNLFLFLCFYLPFQIALNPVSGIDMASIRILILFIFFIWLWDFLKNKPPHQLNKNKINEQEQFDKKDKSRFSWCWGKKNIFVFNIQTKAVLFFLFLSDVSLFFAQNYSWAARKLLYLFSIFPIYFVAVNILDKREKIIKSLRILVLSGATLSIFGIFQFFLQFFWNFEKISKAYVNYIGPIFWGENLTQMVSKYPSWFVGISGQNYFRSIATFPDPHSLSLFLGMMLPLSVALFFLENKKIWAFSFGTIFLANVLTFSRGGYLAITSGVIVFILLFWRRIEGKHKLMASATAIFFVLMFSVPGPVSGRFASSFSPKEGSNAGRINMWQRSLEIIKEKPMFGTGIGNFSLAVDNAADYRNPIYAHNTYLDIAVEEGILASLVWMFILFITLLNFWIFSKKDLLHAGFFISVVIFSAHSMVETGLYSPAVLSFFLIIISLSSQHEE
jgi:O-antigen ligase